MTGYTVLWHTQLSLFDSRPLPTILLIKHTIIYLLAVNGILPSPSTRIFVRSQFSPFGSPKQVCVCVLCLVIVVRWFLCGVPHLFRHLQVPTKIFVWFLWCTSRVAVHILFSHSQLLQVPRFFLLFWWCTSAVLHLTDLDSKLVFLKR